MASALQVLCQCVYHSKLWVLRSAMLCNLPCCGQGMGKQIFTTTPDTASKALIMDRYRWPTLHVKSSAASPLSRYT